MCSSVLERERNRLRNGEKDCNFIRSFIGSVIVELGFAGLLSLLLFFPFVIVLLGLSTNSAFASLHLCPFLSLVFLLPACVSKNTHRAAKDGCCCFRCWKASLPLLYDFLFPPCLCFCLFFTLFSKCKREETGREGGRVGGAN